MPKRCCENCVYATRLWGRWLRIIMTELVRPAGLLQQRPVPRPDAGGLPDRLLPQLPAPALAPAGRIEPPEPPDDSIRYIPLTKGQYAIVDAEDYERVNQYKWCASGGNRKRTMYAMRIQNHKCILMHRFLMGASEGMVVDHINGNGLNNRKSNLRLCSRSRICATAPAEGNLPASIFARRTGSFTQGSPRTEKTSAKVHSTIPSKLLAPTIVWPSKCTASTPGSTFPTNGLPKSAKPSTPKPKPPSASPAKATNPQTRQAKEKMIHPEAHEAHEETAKE